MIGGRRLKGKSAPNQKRNSAEPREGRGGFRFKAWWLRRPIQVISFTLLFGVIWGLGPWPLLIPAEYPLGTPWRSVGSAFDALQKMLSEGTVLWLLPASILLVCIVSGRAFCGWVCPFGFILDLLNLVAPKHKNPSLKTHDTLKKMKYGILALTFLISGTIATTIVTNPTAAEEYKGALGAFASGPFSALSPSGTLFTLIPMFTVNVLPTLPPLFLMSWEQFTKIATPLLVTRVILLAAVLIIAVYVPRFWCRYLCPQGALMAVISRFSFLGLRRDPIRCTKCRICHDKCPMLVRILNLPYEKFSNSECTLCLECRDACPTDALKLKAP